MAKTLRLLLLLFLITLSQEAHAADYFYDKNGRLESIKSSNNAVDFYYDLNGNLTKKNLNGNLIRNGNFEFSKISNGIALYWNPYAPPGAQLPVGEVVSTTVTNGSQAQKISSNGVGGIFQDVTVAGDASYELNGRILINNLPSGTVKLVVDYYNASGNVINGVVPSETSILNTWTTVGGIIKTPVGATTARIHFHIPSSTGGTVVIDMVSMKKSSNGNMLANGDFEASHMGGAGDGWGKHGANGEYQLISSNVTSGVQAQKVVMTGVGGLFQDVAVKGNTTYELNSRVNVTNLTSGGKVQLIVDYFDAGGKEIGGVTLAETSVLNTWTTIGGSLQVPASATAARIHFHVTSAAGGTFLIDMVSLAKSTDGNMLANGNFEASQIGGAADGWGKYGAAGEYQLLTSNVTSGAQAQKIIMTGVGGLFQDVAVKGNTAYELSSRVNVTNLASGGRVQLLVDYYDAAGKVISGVTPSETSVLNTWTTMGAALKTPAGATAARIHFHVTSSAGGAFLIDMVRLAKSTDGNMLANGDFEASHTGGAADGWAKYGATGEYQLVTSNVFSGIQAQKMVLSGTGGLFQDVAIVSSASYEMNGRVRISNLPSGTVKLIVDYYDAAGKKISGVTLGEVSTLNSWATIGGTLKAPAGAVMARIHFHIASPAGGAAEIDKVLLKNAAGL